MSQRTVIVDDEPLGRDLLRTLLADHEDVQLIEECKNGAEAISCLRSNPVDLLFLGVQMPRINGFDVAQEIGLPHLPPTVFVTAYHEHAVQAFEIHAVDYVTKPIDPERLQTALKRVREKIAALHVGKRGYMIRESISNLNLRLNPRKFLRIHRSSLVNLNQISEIFREGQSDWSVVLRNGNVLRMGRSGRQRLSAFA